MSAAQGRSLFVAGTDTGVGKTWVATRLLRDAVRAGHRAAGMKPVAAGAAATPHGLRNEDALALLAAGNVPMPYSRCNPCCLARATSPHLAAREASITINLDAIEAEYRLIVPESDVIIVEGAGGWLAPIGESPASGAGAGAGAGAGGGATTMADVAVRLGLPVLLVVGLRLGALNHALLTAEAIARSGLPLAGWVGNSPEPRLPGTPGFADVAGYLHYLTSHLPAPRIDLL